MRIAALVLALAACQPQAGDEPVPGAIDATGHEIAGTVDGEPITTAMVDAVFQRIPSSQVERLKATGQYDEFLDRIAVGQLLYEQALERGLHEEEQVQVSMAMAQRDVLAGALLDRVGDETVTDEAVKAAYDEHAVQFGRPSVKARHIVVKGLSKAERLKQQIEGGADFAALAREHSTDRGTRARGGDLGWFEKERMFSEVSEAAFAAEPGDLLGPIETRIGYHLVLVEDKRDETPLAEVRPQLEQQLEQQAVDDYIDDLKARATIQWRGAATRDDAQGGE